jgi:hypothetical protein
MPGVGPSQERCRIIPLKQRLSYKNGCIVMVYNIYTKGLGEVKPESASIIS